MNALDYFTEQIAKEMCEEIDNEIILEILGNYFLNADTTAFVQRVLCDICKTTLTCGQIDVVPLDDATFVAEFPAGHRLRIGQHRGALVVYSTSRDTCWIGLADPDCDEALRCEILKRICK